LFNPLTIKGVTSAVGMITSAAQAESILINEDADLVMMAQELLRDPCFPLRAVHEIKENIAWPLQYEKARW